MNKLLQVSIGQARHHATMLIAAMSLLALPGTARCAEVNGDEDPRVNKNAMPLRLVGTELGDCVQPDQTMTVFLGMRELDQPVRGYQAHLEFNPAIIALDPNQSYYSTTHFGQPLTQIVDIGPGHVYLSAEIDANQPYPGPTDPNVIILATLTFKAVGNQGDLAEVEFMSNSPPDTLTRFIKPAGDTLWPNKEPGSLIYLDGTPPAVNVCCEDITVSCTDEIPPGATTVYEFEQDAFGYRGDVEDDSEWYQTLHVDFSEVQSGDGCPATPLVIKRRYTVFDCAGNVNDPNTCVQTITVVDDTPPVLVEPNSVVLECSANLPSPVTTIQGFRTLPGAAADDNCTDPNDLTLTVVDGPLDGTECDGTITRTYTIADRCGNESIADRVFIIQDDVDPTMTAPDDVDLTCSADLPPAATTITEFLALSNADAADNCTAVADLTVHHSDTDLIGSECGGTITRTYTIEDACGNTIQDDQVFTIADTVDPQFDRVPPDVTIECHMDSDPNTIADPNTGVPLGWATATDNCTATADIVVEFLDDPNLTDLSGCNDTGVIRRIWTITDACGNTPTSVIQTITVVDTIKPHFTNTPADVTIQCHMPTDPNQIFDPNTGSLLGWPTAEDNCTASADIVIDYMDDPNLTDLTGCNGTGTIVRRWTATDACGNTADVHVQTITIIDTLPPEFTSIPPDITVECDMLTDPNNLNGWADAEDNCTDEPNIHIHYHDRDPVPRVDLGGCNGTGIIRRYWYAVDACGNEAESPEPQIITVVDTKEPNFTYLPLDVTVECSVALDPSNLDPNNIVDPNTGERLGWPQAIDNCGMDPNRPFIFIDGPNPNGCNGTGVLERSWYALDECGNMRERMQTITIVDTVPPQFDTTPPRTQSLPMDTGQCSRVYALEATASDTCSTPTITFWQLDPNTPGDPNDPNAYVAQITDPGAHEFFEGTTYLLARSVDGCGLHTDYTFAITIVDTEAPQITCPANIVIDNYPGACGNVAVFPASATDNCTAVPDITYWIDSDPNATPGLFDREITIADTFPVGTTPVLARAEDLSGNQTPCTFTVTVHDAEDPIIEDCPNDLTVIAAPGAPEAPATWEPPTPMDNCVITEWTSTHVPNDIFPIGVTPVTYTARDAAGNEATCAFNVTVVPTDEVVVDIELSSPELVWPGVLTRCFDFEVWDCNSMTVFELSELVTFTDGVGQVSLAVPSGTYDCLAVADPLHTLQQTVPLVDAGDYYEALVGGGDWLISGNLYEFAEEPDTIGLYDFGALVGEWGRAYGTGDTDCDTPPFHADVDGDGMAYVEDYSFIQANFGQTSAADCCTGTKLRSSAASFAVLADLSHRGLTGFETADRDADGLLDTWELADVLHQADWLDPRDVPTFSATRSAHRVHIAKTSRRGDAGPVDLELFVVSPDPNADVRDIALVARHDPNNSAHGPGIASLSAVLTWTPADALTLLGKTDNGPYRWLVSRLGRDPYGLNDDLSDGDAIFAALAQLPPDDVAQATTEGLLITTLHFEVNEPDGNIMLGVDTPAGGARTKIFSDEGAMIEVQGNLDRIALTPGPQVKPGDCNCDGVVDYFDIEYFLESLGDDEQAWRGKYIAQYGTEPPCSFNNCDADQNGTVDYFDINVFLSLLGT